MQEKEFVSYLETLIKATREFADVDKLHYIKVEGEGEYIYVTFTNTKQQKIINVSGDSLWGILTDFVEQAQSAQWVHSEHPKYIKFDKS